MKNFIRTCILSFGIFILAHCDQFICDVCSQHRIEYGEWDA